MGKPFCLSLQPRCPPLLGPCSLVFQTDSRAATLGDLRRYGWASSTWNRVRALHSVSPLLSSMFEGATTKPED